MCGRYYVDDNTVREIEKVIRQVDERFSIDSRAGVSQNTLKLSAGDIHPTELAPVLVTEHGTVGCRMLRWGLPGFVAKERGRKRPVIFNARSETAMDKPAFRDGIRSRRIVVPAAWFYEWNCRKEKNTFRRQDSSVLFMAGCYNHYEDGDRFVILTTAANASMEPVHDRMPLILERDELAAWLFDGAGRRSCWKRSPVCWSGRQTMSRCPFFNRYLTFYTGASFFLIKMTLQCTSCFYFYPIRG